MVIPEIFRILPERAAILKLNFNWRKFHPLRKRKQENCFSKNAGKFPRAGNHCQQWVL
jgi:hypothetical protein